MATKPPRQSGTPIKDTGSKDAPKRAVSPMFCTGTETALSQMPTNAHPQEQYEHPASRFLVPSVPLSRQVMNQVYSGMAHGGMSFGSHLTDPKDQPDSDWPDQDNRFGSDLKKGNR